MKDDPIPPNQAPLSSAERAILKKVAPDFDEKTIRRRSDREYDFEFSGGSVAGPGEYSYSSWLPLRVLRWVYTGKIWPDAYKYLSQNSYQSTWYQTHDWSCIRDSHALKIWQMFDAVINHHVSGLEDLSGEISASDAVNEAVWRDWGVIFPNHISLRAFWEMLRDEKGTEWLRNVEPFSTYISCKSRAVQRELLDLAEHWDFENVEGNVSEPDEQRFRRTKRKELTDLGSEIESTMESKSLIEAVSNLGYFEERFRLWLKMARKRMMTRYAYPVNPVKFDSMSAFAGELSSDLGVPPPDLGDNTPARDTRPVDIRAVVIKVEGGNWVTQAHGAMSGVLTGGSRTVGGGRKPNFIIAAKYSPSKYPDPDDLKLLKKVYPIMNKVLVADGGINSFTHRPIPVWFDSGCFTSVDKAIIKGDERPREEIQVSTPERAYSEFRKSRPVRRPDLEPVLLKDLEIALEYAIFLGFRWPELDRRLLASSKTKDRGLYAPRNAEGFITDYSSIQRLVRDYLRQHGKTQVSELAS